MIVDREAIVARRAHRAQQWEQRFEIPTLIAALLVLPTLVIEETELAGIWPVIATAFNWLIWLVFFTEAALVLALTPNRWNWIKTHPLELLVVVLTPPFLPAALQSTRLLRLLRLSRLALTARHLRKLFSLGGLKFATLLALFGILGAGALFSAIEGNGHLST
ncbi:MAG: hypothetical protein ACR2GX_03280 [Candidatus Dormibacteria bacterium]